MVHVIHDAPRCRRRVLSLDISYALGGWGGLDCILGLSPRSLVVGVLFPVSGGCSGTHQQGRQRTLHEADPLDERAASLLQRGVPPLVVSQHPLPVARVAAVGLAEGTVDICSCCGSH